MEERPTHGWCPSCKQESAIDAFARCLWCEGETEPIREKRGGGKPPGKWGKLTDRQLRALHRMHDELGLPARELGRRIWGQAGYASENSATNAMLYGWRRLGLRALSQPEAAARANESRRAPGSPGTADRRIYKRWLRRQHGGYRMCRGVKLQAPGKGQPCTRYALVGSDYCYVHDPARREEIVAHTTAMRERIGEAA